MSFRGGGGFRGGRGGGGGGFRGGRGGGGGWRGGGGGGFRGGYQDQGPPEEVIEVAYYMHPCQDSLVCKATLAEKVPYFNAPIYLENKQQVGKIDEIFGNVRDYSVSVKLSDDVKPKSFQPNQKLYIDPNKLLPLQRFLGSGPGGGRVQKRGGGGRGGGFGGRGGGGRGGRGGGGFGGRGGGRGGFGGRGGGGGFRGGRGGGFGGRGGGGGGFRGGRGGRY